MSRRLSTTEYTGFDILGRVTSHKQTTDGNEYATAYKYNPRRCAGRGDLSVGQSRPEHLRREWRSRGGAWEKVDSPAVLGVREQLQVQRRRSGYPDATRERSVGVDPVQLAPAADTDRDRHDTERDEPPRSRLHLRNDSEQRQRAESDDHGSDGGHHAGVHGASELQLRSLEPIAASR